MMLAQGQAGARDTLSHRQKADTGDGGETNMTSRVPEAVVNIAHFPRFNGDDTEHGDPAGR